MKNIGLLGIFLMLTSCAIIACENANEFRRHDAQKMYEAFGTLPINMSDKKAQEIFGCYYQSGDDVYLYKTLWRNMYILVRDEKPITYVESGEKFLKF